MSELEDGIETLYHHACVLEARLIELSKENPRLVNIHNATMIHNIRNNLGIAAREARENIKGSRVDHYQEQARLARLESNVVELFK